MILHCPNCSSPLLKEFEIESDSPRVDFKATIRCPHCQATTEIKVGAITKYEVSIGGKKLDSEKTEKDSTRKTRVL